MAESAVERVVRELVALSRETEWVEFKCNYANPEEIGEYLSAIANAAALQRKERGYIVWGVDDSTHEVVGTKFRPAKAKKGNEELEGWLCRLLNPRVDFRIREGQVEGKRLVVFEVPPALHTPIRFGEVEYIRVGTYKKKLKDYPEKERALWAIFRRETFESGIAHRNATADEVLASVDYPAFFQLLGQSLPETRAGILEKLTQERVIAGLEKDGYDITNLGAILFARKLGDFESLDRKAIRVVLYKGSSRIETLKEQPGARGYAVGFAGLVAYINDQLPRNEEIKKALRRDVRMYPELAVRELVANALIHQDFSITGTGPMVEVFADRIEISNPGVPLIDTLRFIDEPPQSRNEVLAALMRRMNICEERGSGIDKVISQVELFQLPAPDFQVTSGHTKVVLYAPKKLSEMTQADRMRACYQHACLCWVSNKVMTNTSVRQRFGIDEKNYPMASRIISETVKTGLIKAADPSNKSRRMARYVPFWL